MNKVISPINRESCCMTLAMFLLSIYSFFNYLYPKNISYAIIVLCGIILFFTVIIKKNFLVTFYEFLLVALIILFILIQLLLARYSIFPDSSIKGALFRSAILAIGALFYIQAIRGNWFEFSIKIIFIFSFIHVLFTLFSFLMPNTFNDMILPVLPDHVSTETSWFMNRGLYPGITDQIGRNAFYISVGISVLFSQFVVYRYRFSKPKYIFLGLFFLALLLTGKRGQLIASVISMVLVFGIHAKVKGKKFWVNILKISIVFFLMFLILIFVFPQAAKPFTRFIERLGGDQTSGRIPLFSGAIRLFVQKPIFGWGVGVFSNLYGTGTHNMYLQLLAENGLIGFFLFSAILIINCVNTFKEIKRNIFKKERQYISYLMFSLYFQIFYIIYGLVGNAVNDGYILVFYLIVSSIPYMFRKIYNRTYQKCSNLIDAHPKVCNIDYNIGNKKTELLRIIKQKIVEKYYKLMHYKK